MAFVGPGQARPPHDSRQAAQRRSKTKHLTIIHTRHPLTVPETQPSQVWKQVSAHRHTKRALIFALRRSKTKLFMKEATRRPHSACKTTVTSLGAGTRCVSAKQSSTTPKQRNVRQNACPTATRHKARGRDQQTSFKHNTMHGFTATESTMYVRSRGRRRVRRVGARGGQQGGAWGHRRAVALAVAITRAARRACHANRGVRRSAASLEGNAWNHAACV